MSLYPGGRVAQGGGFVPSVDNAALANSMAGLIEQEFDSLFQSINQTPVPAEGRNDRRILFVAIARGLLRYLDLNDTANITANLGTNPAPVSVSVDLNKP